MAGRAIRWVFGATALLGATLGVAEATMRVLIPMPRVQVVRGGTVPRPDLRPIVMLHGEPMWEEAGSAERQNLGCRREGTRDVLMLGSSVFFGTGYGAEAVMSRRLQDRLDAAEPGLWCVLNFAQPGYTGRSKLALAREHVPGLKPELVLWELWINDPGGFTMLGSTAYNLTRLTVDPLGYPTALPVPDGLNRRLFHGSRLWEYATLTLAPQVPQATERVWTEVIEQVLPEVDRVTEVEEADWAIVYTPPLDRPFARSAARADPNLVPYGWVAAWAEAQGVPQLDLAAALAETTPEAVRHDACCHYNAVGHERVAVVMEGLVRQLWSAREARLQPGGAQ
jgi:hypothetical protein